MKPLLACEVDIDKINFPIYVSTKYDGCFTGGTKIWTEKGLMQIKDIVTNKLNIKVASYNEVTKKVEFKKVVGWFNNGLKPASEWLSFGEHRVTKTHKVYSNNSWVHAEEYENGGIFVNSDISSIITGMLLGDSVASIDKRYNLSWRMSWCNSVKDEQYGDNKSLLISNLFGGRNVSKKYKTSGYGVPVAYYVTPSCANLPFDVSKFYNTDKESDNYGKRKDVLTLEDLSDFDDISLAIWFFDDGSISYNNGNIKTPRIMFSVPRYSDETHNTFKKLFKSRYNINASIVRRGKDATITFTTPDSWYLLSIIAKVGGGLCKRKIPEIFKVSEPKPVEFFTKSSGIIGKSISGSKNFTAYDIEVEDNHNYFANGMLVHNCRALVIDSIVYSRSLKPIRNKHVQQLFGKPEYEGFDGELVVGDIYAKDVFQKTTSGVMSEDGEPDVTFYVFDIFSDSFGTPEHTTTYRERLYELNDRLVLEQYDNIVAAQQKYVCNKEELLEMLEIERIRGGEGLIGRTPNGKYKYGRSTPKEQLCMKFKFFVDSEFEVIGFEELHKNTNEQVINELGYAKRSTHKKNQIPMNTLGSLVLKFGDTTFNVGSGFTDVQRAEIWANRDNYIGKLAAVRYMDVGAKLVPRLPIFKGWRDLDDIS